jgi:hypothetical protein
VLPLSMLYGNCTAHTIELALAHQVTQKPLHSSCSDVHVSALRNRTLPVIRQRTRTGGVLVDSTGCASCCVSAEDTLNVVHVLAATALSGIVQVSRDPSTPTRGGGAGSLAQKMFGPWLAVWPLAG